MNFNNLEPIHGMGFVGIIIIMFLVALAVLWFILPFAIFGIKSRLDELVEETRKTNTFLQEIMLKEDKTNTISDPKKGRHMSFND